MLAEYSRTWTSGLPFVKDLVRYHFTTRLDGAAPLAPVVVALPDDKG